MGKWEMVRLGDICEISPPKKELSTVDKEIEVSFVPMADLQSHQKLFHIKETKKLSEVIKSYTYFRDNDVLLAKITPCFENGKCGIAKNLTNGVGFGSTEFIVLRPNSNVLSEWVYYCVARSKFLAEGSRNMTGTAGQQRVQQDFVKSYIIPLPPLEIQKQIGQTLDVASELIALYKKQLAELDNLIKSTFYDMFGDPVTNDKGWEVTKLGLISTLKSGKFVASSEIYDLSSQYPYPCFGGNGVRGYVEKYSHEGEYALIGRQGALCGNVQLTHGKFYATEHAVVVSPIIAINPQYLFYVLKRLNLNSLASGAAQPGLTVEKLNGVKIPIPPLTLQTQFAATVTAIEFQKSLIQTALSESQTLFESLMSQYFD